jgi:menaquinone-dependent protoporphyrinogen IX oxidase
MMNVCIVYESKYGNGKKCMEYLQGVIRKKGHTVEMFSIHEKDPTSLPSADLYIFSSPTQIGSLAGKMKKFLKKLELPKVGVKYALVTTCMNPPKTKSLRVMEKLLQSRDLSKVSDGLMIKVTGMSGPLESGFEEKLDAFANDILR